MTQTSHLSRQDLDTLAVELDAIYDDAPSTCCANSGECCSLTPAEMDEGWATMFPLYKAEYARIADHVPRTFNAERAAKLLSITDERPERCPFLGDDNGCTIYAVRPLICRTYAVMNHQTIGEAVERSRGTAPEDWIRGFVLREGGMVCPRVTVAEPEKLEKHAQNLIDSTYERELLRLSGEHELADSERKYLFQKLTWRRSWPVRWTWGGFNCVATKPLDWVREHFKKYWKKAELANAL